MVLEIRSATDRIFCYFGKWKSIVPEIWSVTDELFVVLGYFLRFYPTNNPKNQKFWKNWKETAGDIIILHQSTTNHDHMLYYSWDMERDGCNLYFSFWAIFALLPPLTAQKFKIKKKNSKTPGDIIIFHMCNKNYYHMMYGSWDMVRDRWTEGLKKRHIEAGAPPKNSMLKMHLNYLTL